MTALPFTFRDETLHALPSGGLYWPRARSLVVSDLHFGKAERVARRGGAMLPPYELQDTAERLCADIAQTDPARVICLGDSFDDLAAAHAVEERVADLLTPVMAGRDWIWIEGNHDPGPVGLPGRHLAQITLAPFHFRHLVEAPERGCISGHYHPSIRLQIRGRSLSRRAILFDETHLILPAYGTYTGGLRSSDPALTRLFGQEATAIAIGPQPRAIPLPR